MATAQDTRWSEDAVVHFDRPVLIPGKVLEPGTYVFQLADTRGDREVMQVYTQDPNAPDHERDLVATTATVPTTRARSDQGLVLEFAGADGANPIALKAFFYPGTLRGHEFVYPHDEAIRMAKATNTVVLSRDVNGNWAAWGATRQPSPPARTRWMHDTDAVGTSGGNPPASTDSRTTPEQHAAAIARLVDQALHGSGTTITIDRSTLEQIRSHAEAIQNGGGDR